jgi:hypothetical protein
VESKFKYAEGEIVTIDGVECEIIAREMFDGEPDFLCRPLIASESIMGEEPGGSSWVRLQE